MGMTQSLSASVNRCLSVEQLQAHGKLGLSKQDLIREIRKVTPTPGQIRMGTLARAALRKWAYNLSAFNRYGLHHNDCYDEDDPDVKEAVRRLPAHLKDERNFRIFRAMHLSMCKIYLPEKEWTQYEEDNRYLQPYIDQVINEREEREEWNRNN